MPVHTKTSFPAIPAVLAMNVFPLIGVVFFDWSFFAIIYIYWWETVILSIFTLFKMRKAAARAVPNPSITINGSPQTEEMVNNKTRLRTTYITTRIFTLFIYIVFILVFMGMYEDFQTAVNIVFFIDTFIKVSLGIVFVYYLTDYLVWKYSGEWKETTAAELAVPFDGRAIVMHVVIVLGAVSTAFVGDILFGTEKQAAPILYTSFFVLMKTSVDVYAIRKQVNRERMVGDTIFDRSSGSNQ